MTRRSVFSKVAAVGALFSITGASLAQGSDKDLLIGAWRHVALVRVVDGNTLAPQNFDGTTILAFKGDGTWSMIAPNSKSSGRYRWLGTGQIETTTTESWFAVQLGMVSAKSVRVDKDRLNLITVQTKEELEKLLPAPKPGVARPESVTITSIFSRNPNR